MVDLFLSLSLSLSVSLSVQNPPLKPLNQASPCLGPLGAFTLIASPASPDLSFFMCACVVENGDVGRKKS